VRRDRGRCRGRHCSRRPLLRRPAPRRGARGKVQCDLIVRPNIVGPRSCAFRIVNTRYLASHRPTRGRHRHGSLLRALCSGGGARSFTCVLRLQVRAIKCAASSHARVRWLDRRSVRVPLPRTTKDPPAAAANSGHHPAGSHSGGDAGWCADIRSEWARFPLHPPIRFDLEIQAPRYLELVPYAPAAFDLATGGGPVIRTRLRAGLCRGTRNPSKADALAFLPRIPAGDESVADIAVKTGFASQAHLSTIFFKELGTTPARSRAAFRPDHPSRCCRARTCQKIRGRLATRTKLRAPSSFGATPCCGVDSSLTNHPEC
jgi:AraC-like DNA-binding protein